MTISDINNWVTFKTGADTTVYSAANRLISSNRWMHKIWTMILDAQGNWDADDYNQTTFPIISTALVASQRDYDLNPLTNYILQIKRVDISYDGSTYYRATPIDVNEIQTGVGNDTNLDQHFSTTAPRYDLKYGSIFIYPMPTASTGYLRVEFLREAMEFTSAEVTTGTKEPGFDEPFHIMVALGMIYDFCTSKTSPHLMKLADEVKGELVEYEVRLRKFYGIKDMDRVATLNSFLPDYK